MISFTNYESSIRFLIFLCPLKINELLIEYDFMYSLSIVETTLKIVASIVLWVCKG